MYTKDTHLYTTSSIFPLRQSVLEGVRVSVPYGYEQLLIEEYGPRALTETRFNGWEFVKERKGWVKKVDPLTGRPIEGGKDGGRKDW